MHVWPVGSHNTCRGRSFQSVVCNSWKETKHPAQINQKHAFLRESTWSPTRRCAIHSYSIQTPYIRGTPCDLPVPYTFPCNKNESCAPVRHYIATSAIPIYEPAGFRLFWVKLSAWCIRASTWAKLEKTNMLEKTSYNPSVLLYQCICSSSCSR